MQEKKQGKYEKKTVFPAGPQGRGAFTRGKRARYRVNGVYRVYGETGVRRSRRDRGHSPEANGQGTECTECTEKRGGRRSCLS